MLGEARQAQPAAPQIYLVHSGEEATRMAWRVAEQLRDAGLTVLLHCGGGGFKQQMKKADASGAQFAVIVGDDEAAAQRLSLKPLRENAEQVSVTVEAAIERVRAAHAAT
jgi:histidyl-tRNA synthetase